jgi:hypothetical protein
MTASVKTHKKFSASQADRYLNCPGSIRLAEGVPSLPESAAAREGTDAHFVLETILTDLISGKKEDVSKFQKDKKKYSPEMISHAVNAAKEITRRAPKGAKLFCEQKVDNDLKYIDPDFGGTLDAAIAEPFGRLEVIDYKYGAGIPVDAADNPQLIAYALALYNRFDRNFSEIRITIIQPRAFHESGNVVRSWDTTPEVLEHWELKFKKGIKACRDPKAPVAAGDWCRFCPAKHICPAVSTDAMKQAQIDFAPDKGLTAALEPADVEVGRLAVALSAADKLEHWIAGVKARAYEVLNAGGVVPGYKLVPKRASRVWVDPDKAFKTAFKELKGVAFDYKLKSPAQLEKVPGAKDFVKKHAASVSSGLTMVSDRDPRPAATSAKSDFLNTKIALPANKKTGKNNATKKQ